MTTKSQAGTLPGEHYARTDTGELIGPYDTARECERERLAANAESAPTYTLSMGERARWQDA